MKPRQEKPKTTKPRTQEKPNRFRIVQFEPRIAPTNAGKISGAGDGYGGLTGTSYQCSGPPGHCK
jgi:hypothetical protein